MWRTPVRTDLQSSPRCSRSRCSSRRITAKTRPASPTSASRASSPTLRCALPTPNLPSLAFILILDGPVAARPDHHRLRGAGQPSRSRQNRRHRLPGRVRYRRERLRPQVIPIQPFLCLYMISFGACCITSWGIRVPESRFEHTMLHNDLHEFLTKELFKRRDSIHRQRSYF